MKNINYFSVLISKMEYFNYSKHTIKIYSHYVDEFIHNVNIFPSKMTSETFQNYISNYNFTSTSQQNQVISSIKFFYEKILNKKYHKIDIQRPRSEKKLP